MPVSTLTSKGQITLPREVRRALGLAAGDQVEFLEDEGGYRLVPRRTDVRALRGRFAGRVSAPVSLEAMEEAIAEEAARRR